MTKLRTLEAPGLGISSTITSSIRHRNDYHICHRFYVLRHLIQNRARRGICCVSLYLSIPLIISLSLTCSRSGYGMWIRTYLILSWIRNRKLTNWIRNRKSTKWIQEICQHLKKLSTYILSFNSK